MVLTYQAVVIDKVTDCIFMGRFLWRFVPNHSGNFSWLGFLCRTGFLGIPLSRRAQNIPTLARILCIPGTDTPRWIARALPRRTAAYIM